MSDITTPATTATPAATSRGPICKTCKQPLIRTSEEFWTCETPACRGLITDGTVIAASYAKRDVKAAIEA